MGQLEKAKLLLTLAEVKQAIRKDFSVKVKSKKWSKESARAHYDRFNQLVNIIESMSADELNLLLHQVEK